MCGEGVYVSVVDLWSLWIGSLKDVVPPTLMLSCESLCAHSNM